MDASRVIELGHESSHRHMRRVVIEYGHEAIYIYIYIYIFFFLKGRASSCKVSLT